MAVVRVKTKPRVRGGRDYKLDLAALERGDRVATVDHTVGRNFVTGYVVVRKTPTQVVAEARQHGRTREDRWRIADGKKIGHSYGASLLAPDDDEVIDILQRDLLYRFRDQAAKLTTPEHRETWDHNQRLEAVAKVAELAADTAEDMNKLEARRVKP